MQLQRLRQWHIHPTDIHLPARGWAIAQVNTARPGTVTRRRSLRFPRDRTSGQVAKALGTRAFHYDSPGAPRPRHHTTRVANHFGHLDRPSGLSRVSVRNQGHRPAPKQTRRNGPEAIPGRRPGSRVRADSAIPRPSGRRRRTASANAYALKYFASGCSRTNASVDCSGCSCNSSDSTTPMRSASSRSTSLARSSNSGQAP